MHSGRYHPEGKGGMEKPVRDLVKQLGAEISVGADSEPWAGLEASL